MASKELHRVYKALIDGAYEGETDENLRRFVLTRLPNANSKNIIRASVLAMGDSSENDPLVLENIFSLAIKHRFMRSDRRNRAIPR